MHPLRDGVRRKRETYSLAEALIPTSTLPKAVAALAARYLRELLVGGAVVGVSWGELVARVVRKLEARGPLPQCDIVQLLGGTSSLQSSLHATELVGRLSVLTGGAAYALHAPLVLPDVITTDGLRREESIARTLEASRALDVAVVEIGGWGLGGTQVLDQLPVADRQATIDQGVVANVCGIFLGADGSRRAREVSDRLVSVWQHDLSSAAVRIGVVEGPAAAEAARAAVNSGLLTVLATDAATADLLL